MRYHNARKSYKQNTKTADNLAGLGIAVIAYFLANLFGRKK